MATSSLQDQRFAVGKVSVPLGGSDRQPKHLALKHGLVHLGHQRGQGLVVHAAQHRTAAGVAHQQVFAKRLDYAGQTVGVQSQFARPIQLVQCIEFRAADMAVGDKDECHDACGGFGAVARIGAHGGCLS